MERLLFKESNYVESPGVPVFMWLSRVGRHFFHLLGVQDGRSTHPEKIVSSVGGFIGIIAITLVSNQILGTKESTMIIASMGASCVLLFAVPHGPLSQPWAVLGGHTLSASIGVTCGLLIADAHIAAALAVGLSIGTMYYLRCIHPPGGATALTAVIGGGAIESMGYQFVLTPVLVNACILILVATAVNFPFRARRYPLALNHYVDRLKRTRE